MGLFRNLKIQSKLMFVNMLIVFTGFIFIGWNMYYLIQINDQINQTRNDTSDILEMRENLEDFQSSVVNVKNYLLTSNESFLFSYQSNYAKVDQGIEKLLIHAANSEQISDFNTLSSSIEDYKISVLNILNDLKNNRFTEIGELSREIDRNAEQINENFNNTIFKREQALVEKGEESDEEIREYLTFNLIGIILLVLLAALSAITTGQVSEPMQYLTNAVVSFENNAYDQSLLNEYINQKNEMGKLARAINNMVSSISEAVQEKDTFLEATQRFIPTEYLEFLEKDNITKVKLGDHVSAEMAIMFSDIRSFTTMSEKMTPQENFDFVNEYLGLVSPIIKENNGFVVKFLGDGMMAIFPYGADDAIRAGIEKKILVNKFNTNQLSKNLPPIDVGIGIHTGHMMVGMIGEDRRMQGDAFSDNVNLTSRVEGLTKFYGVSLILTEEALMRVEVKKDYQIRFLGKALVKGKKLPLSLYEIMDGDTKDITLPKQKAAESFAEGLKHYINGNLAKAKTEFNKSLKTNPEDKAAQFYTNEIDSINKKKLPKDWDGVVLMTSK